MRALLLCALLSGCALLQPPPPKPPPETISLRAVAGTLEIGSTKADIRAALGQGMVVDFNTGYEVWVYRERPQETTKAPGAELVLLFEPSGTLARMRVR